MSEWVDFSRWPDCKEMERPGIVFEVANAEDLRMLTPCAVQFQVPLDWKSGPMRFRPVAQSRPQHSSPIPAPRERK